MEKASSVRAAIYARISRDREGAGLGVDLQETDCRALAERLGWDVVAVFVDNDISAYSGAPRPQYRAMIEAVRAGEIHGVLAWHTDRLHRRATELEEFVTIAEAHDLQIQTVTAGVVDLATPSGRMVARMLGAAAQHEVEQTRRRVKSAKERAAVDGKFRGGPRPYGFDKDGVTIREPEAKIIREMTKAVLAGRSIAALTRELNIRIQDGEEAARPSSTRNRDGSIRGTGNWRYGALRDSLIRPRNAGLSAHGLPGNKGAEFEILGKATWPAIVPEDEWRALVALLIDPSRNTNPEGNGLRWLGSGIYRCGAGLVDRDKNGHVIKDDEGRATPLLDANGDQIICGAIVRATPHGGTETRKHARRFLYRCNEWAHLTIGQRQTDEFVLSVVADLVRDPRIASALNPASIDTSADRERRVALVARLSGFEDDYVNGRIPAALWQKSSAKVEAEIAEIDARLAKALSRASSSSVFNAPDPGAAFLAAPIDVQRAVLTSVLRVDILPAGGRGWSWKPERLKITPVA